MRKRLVTVSKEKKTLQCHSLSIVRWTQHTSWNNCTCLHKVSLFESVMFKDDSVLVNMRGSLHDPSLLLDPENERLTLLLEVLLSPPFQLQAINCEYLKQLPVSPHVIFYI